MFEKANKRINFLEKNLKTTKNQFFLFKKKKKKKVTALNLLHLH